MNKDTKKLGIKKTISIFTGIGIIVLILSYCLYITHKTNHKSAIEQQVAAYEKVINEHPYTKAIAAAENDRLSKNEEAETDGPELAAMQNFLQTMDPALGYVPSERINAVYEMMEQGKFQNKKMAAAINWTERGPKNVGGRTRSILFDPNDPTNKKVWAGSVGGGLWYTNDITATNNSWTKVNDLWDDIAISSIAASTIDTKVMYVSTGEGRGNVDQIRGAGIWKSIDAGATWTRLLSTAGSDFYYIQKIAVQPNTDDLYAATLTGLKRSKDGGTTWTTVLSGNAADFEITADQVLFAAFGVQSGGAIYKSTTGNVGDWIKVSTTANLFQGSGYSRVEIATAPSNANVVYAVLQSSSTSDVLDIYVTKNQGQTWSKVIKPVDKDGGVAPSYTRTQAWYDLSIAVDPNNDSTLVVGGVDLFKSVTGGKSWTQLSHWYGGFSLPNVHADQHTAVFRPGSSDEILFGNDGGVFYTANLTATKPSFLSKNDDYNVTQFYGCALHPGLGSSYCLAGAQDNGSWKFTTPGINTTISASGGDGCFCFIDQDEPNIQLTSYVYNTFYVSTNGGGNFGGTVLSDGNSGSFVNASDYDDVQNILYTYKTASQLYRVTGVGKSPSPSVGTIASSFGSTVTHIRVSPYAPVGTSTVFVGNAAGRVYKVTNANTAAFVNTPLTTPGAGNISCIEIGASEDELLVTMSNYGVKSVYYSIDGGKTWLNKEGNLPDMPVRWALFNPNDRKQVILATEVGVWATDDITAEIPQWSPANNGLANVRVDMLQIRKSDNTVIAATHGRGLFSTDAFTITNAQPVADFNAVMVTPCEGSGVTFKNTSTGIITSYLWDFGAGATPATDSTAGPINVTYSSTGFKSVTLTVKGPGGATISLKSFTINTNPAKPIITQNLNTLSTATTGVIYQWLNNGSTISGATKQTYSATVSSTYTVKVTDNNGCTSMSDPYNFIYSGINTLSADFGIVIFPIPASNEVNVQFNQIRANSLSIVNLKGQVVFEKQQVNEVEKLAISELASGVYLLKLKLMNGKEVVQKLVIKQ